MDWYWRFMMGLSPRLEDRLELQRIAPELFGPDRTDNDVPDGERDEWSRGLWLRRDLRRWLQTDDPRPVIPIRKGSCSERRCPLRLNGSPGRAFSGRPADDEGAIVLRLMTVAGGWKSKSSAFFDMARKVHGGKGAVKDLLLTDPYIYIDKSEEDNVGGIDNFLTYLDCLRIDRGAEITIQQPPYAKGKKATSGAIWRRRVSMHGKTNSYSVRFAFFHAVSQTRFHDRFYVARHANGSISGLFGPSMNGLNDKSFALMGELEDVTLKGLCRQLDGWN